MSELESSVPAPVREGLPPTYRMRAETHYVDLLNEPFAERGALKSRTTGQTPVPAPAPDVPDPTLHAGRDLAQAMATLSACANLLAGPAVEPSRTVVANLIRAEVLRASALVHATRAVRQEMAITRKAVSVGSLVEKTAQDLQPERSIRPFTLETRCNVAHGTTVIGDEAALGGILIWGVLATLPLVDGIPDARLVVSAMRDRDGLTFSVSQDVVTAPAAWYSRAFDAHWVDRPGGVPALVAMLAIDQAARSHGGSARVSASGHGTEITIGLTAGA